MVSVSLALAALVCRSALVKAVSFLVAAIYPDSFCGEHFGLSLRAEGDDDRGGGFVESAFGAREVSWGRNHSQASIRSLKFFGKESHSGAGGVFGVGCQIDTMDHDLMPGLVGVEWCGIDRCIS
jgi:hypothetical protein